MSSSFMSMTLRPPACTTTTHRGSRARIPARARETHWSPRVPGVPVLPEDVAQLAAGRDVQLGEDLAEVPFDRPRAEEQAGTDLRIRVAVPHQLRDLPLLRRQFGIGTGFGRAPADRLPGRLQFAAGPL